MIAGVFSIVGVSIGDCDIDCLKNVFNSIVSNNSFEVNKKDVFILASNLGLECARVVSVEDSCGLLFLSGDPLISGSNALDDARLLVKEFGLQNFNVLQSARGVFCCIYYNNNKLFLCSDKLGVKPLYYSIENDLVYFSTTLKVLERLDQISKKCDLDAQCQVVAFGYPLGSQTVYENVKVVRDSEVIMFDRVGVNIFQYFRWDKIKALDEPYDYFICEVYKSFRESIMLRLKDDRDALCFLSGGMDSRLIVGMLHDLNINIAAFNFSRDNSQDKFFAEQFAQTLDCKITFCNLVNMVSGCFRTYIARTMRNFFNLESGCFTRSYSIWSGDGGSVGLGCVYLDDLIVEMCRSGNVLQAIHQFQASNNIYLPIKSFTKDYKTRYSKFIEDCIQNELNRLDCDDCGQAFFLFLMLNDQRRHLHDFFEDIDTHKLNYHLPFFDSKFLELVFSIPLEYRINHRFYHDLFYYFPIYMTSSPWQTYPGHVSCPLKYDDNLTYQWSNREFSRINIFANNFLKSMQGLKIVFFKKNIGPVSRLNLMLISLLHLCGFRNYSHVIDAATIYSFCR